MEIKINNEDYKNLELEYSKVKIRGIEYRVEECNGKLNIVKISDGSEYIEIFDKDGKALHIADVMAMLLPSEEEINSKLNELKENEFEEDEMIAKREYGYGFRRCYFWLKYQRYN